MSLLEWFTLAGLCWLGAASPGPSLAVVVEQTLKGGRRQGVIAAVAHGVGVGSYALLAAVGLAIIIQQTPWLFDGLRWLGALFLLFLAYKAFTAPADFSEADGESEVSGRQGAVIGFLTAFLNPKLAIFFLAIFSQFVSVDSSIGQKLGMALLTFVIDALWYVMVTLLVSHPSIMTRLQTSAATVQKVFGVLLVLVAFRVIVS